MQAASQDPLQNLVRLGMSGSDIRSRFGKPTSELRREDGTALLVYVTDPRLWSATDTQRVAGFSARLSNDVVTALFPILTPPTSAKLAIEMPLVTLGRRSVVWKVPPEGTLGDPLPMDSPQITLQCDVFVGFSEDRPNPTGIFRMSTKGPQADSLRNFTTQHLGREVVVECDGIVISTERIVQPLGQGSVICVTTNVPALQKLMKNTMPQTRSDP